MDQEKIGKFIAACRKDQGFTQAKLAERLGLTDRAVSKWENGKSMPDASIMLDLCEIMLDLCELLKINVNELLSGERLDTASYKEKAEDNLLELHLQEEKANKKMLGLEIVIGTISVISFCVTLIIAAGAEMPVWARVILIVTGSFVLALGIFYSIKIEREAGYYECQECGARYVPSMKAVIFAPHIGRSRQLKCPYCGKRNYHKKTLTK